MVRSERFAVVAVTTGWGRDRLAVLAQAVDVQDDRLADEAFHLVDRAGRDADTRQFGRVGSVTGHAPLDDHRVTGHVIIPSDPPANGVGEREDGHDTPVDSMPVLAGTAEGIVDDRRPLAGITVLVPRAREQAGAFSLLLRQRGAEPLEVPTIAIRPLRSTSELDLAVGRLVGGAYDWLVLTSVNGVAALRGRMEALGHRAAALAGTRVAAIGPATEAALREWGVPPSLVPPVATTAALGEAFPAGSGEVLLARADIASPELGSILRGKGYRAHDVAAYRTVPLDRLEEGAARRGPGRRDRPGHRRGGQGRRDAGRRHGQRAHHARPGCRHRAGDRRLTPAPPERRTRRERRPPPAQVPAPARAAAAALRPVSLVPACPAWQVNRTTIPSAVLATAWTLPDPSRTTASQS